MKRFYFAPSISLMSCQSDAIMVNSPIIADGEANPDEPVLVPTRRGSDWIDYEQ